MMSDFARPLCWFSMALLVTALATPTAAAADTGLVLMYELIELPAEEDGASSHAYAVNNTGQIVGWVDSAGTRHAAHWHNRVTTDLQGTVHFDLLHPFPYFDRDYAEVYDISNGGQIVGTARTTIKCPDPIEITNAILLRPAVLTDLATPYPGDALTNLGSFGDPCVAYDSAAIGISNSNHVVGWADMGDRTMRAFLVTPVNGHFFVDANDDFVNDIMIDLGTLAASDPVSSATAVNDAGQVTGYSYTINPNGTASYHAFVLNPLDNNDDGVADTWFVGDNAVNDLMVDLGTLGGTNSWGRAINADGQIVGESDYDAPTGEHYTRAFLWQDNTMTDLGTLRDDRHQGFSAASGVNNSGAVVGWAENEDRERRAFVFQNGKMKDLNDELYLLDDNGNIKVPSLTLTEARDINDDGVIVGWGTVRTSGGAVTHGFLLNPKLVDPNELAAAEADNTSDGTDGDTDGSTDGSGTYSSTPDFGPPDFSGSTDDQDSNTPTTTPAAPLLCGTSTLTVLPLTIAGLFLLRLGHRGRH
jgi:probable HAF family extracellular repeat protein